MKKEYSDFLFNFTTDDIGFYDFNKPLKIQPQQEVLLNDILNEVTTPELEKYSNQLHNRWLACGFEFLNTCIEFVGEQNKVKFLEFVWLMFAIERAETEWHSWNGKFDPLYEVKPDTKFAKWFREGVIRFEFKEYSGEHILVPLGNTYNYRWWKNIEHFLDEVGELQTKDYLLKLLDALGQQLKKDEQLSLPNETDKKELLNIFKTWAGSDLSYFDGDSVDWD